MLIPYKELSEDILLSIAKEWVLANLSESEAHPMVEFWAKETVQKIKTGELLVEFGEQSQTVYLKPKESVEVAEGDDDLSAIYHGAPNE